MIPASRWLVAAAVLLSAAGCAASPPVPTARPSTTPTGPATTQQLCDAQTWPRPVPDVVGRLLFQMTDGALGCWDDVRGVAPDGHDPLGKPSRNGEKAYRITAVSPATGTRIGRHDPVTVELAEVDPNAPPALRPCDWVTAAEAGEIMRGPVSADALGDQPGSVDIACIYDKPVEVGDSVEIDLQLPGAFLADAAAQFALATSGERSTAVTGIGVKAACVSEPTTTPPSTTLVVLLERDRLLRVTQGYASCETLKRFAQLVIRRIG